MSKKDNGRAWSDFCSGLVQLTDRLLSHEISRYEFNTEIKDIVKDYEFESLETN